MRLNSRALAAYLLFSFSSASAIAQKAAPYTVAHIIFKSRGENPYTQGALEAASGLKVGATMSEVDLQAAAERLIATGGFADVQASLDGPKKSIDVVFKVQATDGAHRVRASFDNFVWLSHEELVGELRRRIPLFTGMVPESGSEQEAIQTALREMLAAKGVTAVVGMQLAAPQPGQPFRMAEYRVESPSVRLHLLEVAGVPAAFGQTTTKVLHSLIGGPYNDGIVGSYSERVLADYRDAGYLEAALTNVVKIDSATAIRVEVNVAATLHPGEPYRVSKLEWAGSPVMSVAEFGSATKLHAGDVASQSALRSSLEGLYDAYRSKGYMDVVADAVSQLDTSLYQAAFVVTANPGSQYRLRKLNATNLTAAQRKEFDSAWKLKPGDIYNAGYVTSFLKNNTALMTLAGLSASLNMAQDPEAAVIDLDISFKPSAR